MGKKILIPVLFFLVIAAGLTLFVLYTNKKTATVKFPQKTTTNTTFPVPFTINKDLNATISTSSTYKGYTLTLKNPKKIITVLNERGYFQNGQEKKYTIKVSLSDEVATIPPGNVKTMVMAKPISRTKTESEYAFYITPSLIVDPKINKEFLFFFLSTIFNTYIRPETFVKTEVTNAMIYLGNDEYFVIEKK